MSSDDYVTIRQIGKGAYGTAHIVQHKVTGDRFVLKRVRLARQNAKERQCSVRELLLLSNLRHRNVLEYKGCWIEGGCNLCMLVELCESGDLFTQLRLRHPSGIHFSEEHLHEMAVQLLSAVAYLHHSNIAHRDLKTANILITGEGCLKLADFGLSCVLEPETHRLTEAMVGTPNYMSPCVLTKKPYGTPNDVWGLGCVLYELSALKPAFQAFNMAGLIKKVTTGASPVVPSCYSEHWRQLIRSMLTKEASLRPSAEELLQLDWLQPAVRRVADRYGPPLPSGALETLDTLSDLPPDIMGLLDTFQAQEREEKRRADEARERRRAAAAKWDPMARAAAATAAAAAAAAQQQPSKLPPLKPHIPRKPPPRAFRNGVLAIGAATAAGADAATRVTGAETGAAAGRAIGNPPRPDGAATSHRPSSAPPESPARRCRQGDPDGFLNAGDPRALCGHLEVCPDGEDHSATVLGQAGASCSKYEQGNSLGAEVNDNNSATGDGETLRRRGVSSSNIVAATSSGSHTACRRVGSLSGVNSINPITSDGGAASPGANAQGDSLGVVASGSAWGPRLPVPLPQAMSPPSSSSFQRTQSEGAQDKDSCPLDVAGLSGNFNGYGDGGGHRISDGAGRARSRQGWQGQQQATCRYMHMGKAVPQNIDSSDGDTAGCGTASHMDGAEEDGDGEVCQLQSHRMVTVRHSCPAGAFPRRANSEVLFRPNAASTASTQEPSSEAVVGSLTAEGTLEAELTTDALESTDAVVETAAAAGVMTMLSCTDSDFVGAMVQPGTEHVARSSHGAGAAGAKRYSDNRRDSSSRPVEDGGSGVHTSKRASNGVTSASDKDVVGLRGNRAAVKGSTASGSRPSSATGQRAMTVHGAAASNGSRRPSSARRDTCTDFGYVTAGAGGGKTSSAAGAAAHDRGGKRPPSGRTCPTSAHHRQEPSAPQPASAPALRPVGARSAKAVAPSREPSRVPTSSSRPGSVRPSGTAGSLASAGTNTNAAGEPSRPERLNR